MLADPGANEAYLPPELFALSLRACDACLDEAPLPVASPSSEPAWDGVEARDSSATAEAELYASFLAEPMQLAVMAEASDAANEAYGKSKPPKGKPWPKERYIREMKRIRPAKVALVGPDYIGVTSAL